VNSVGFHGKCLFENKKKEKSYHFFRYNTFKNTFK